MHAEARQQLIAALRSGRYRQIRGRFDDGLGGRCVLGLAGYLHLTAAFAPGEASLAMALNDDDGLSFAEIADRLERGALVASYEPPPDLDLEYEQGRWLPKRFAEMRRKLAVQRNGDDEPPPPPLPTVIYIYPRPPVLSGAIGRRLPAGKALATA